MNAQGTLGQGQGQGQASLGAQVRQNNNGFIV